MLWDLKQLTVELKFLVFDFNDFILAVLFLRVAVPDLLSFCKLRIKQRRFLWSDLSNRNATFLLYRLQLFHFKRLWWCCSLIS